MDVLEKLGSCYGIHPLVLEDILTDQRPKIEDYDDYIFIVLKMLYYDENNDKKADEVDEGDLGDSNLDMDQVSMILGPNFIISFKEKEVDVFNPLRDRLRTAKGKIRKQGADYLAYSMIDAIVDHYFVIMEKLGDRFEDLEDAVVSNPEPGILPTIYNLKRDMLFLRKSVWPLREAISKMQRSDSPLVSEAIKIYLRDVYDHTIQVIENIETFRDMSASLLETYLSSLSNKLNEVIKLLTIISTIFIPLTFLAGAVWNELQVHAGAGVPFGLPGRFDINASGSSGNDGLFPEERMDLGMLKLFILKSGLAHRFFFLIMSSSQDFFAALHNSLQNVHVVGLVSGHQDIRLHSGRVGCDRQPVFRHGQAQVAGDLLDHGRERPNRPGGFRPLPESLEQRVHLGG